MTDSALPLTRASHWRDYLALCKPTIVALIVFTAVVGMFLSTPGMVPWDALLFGTLGIGLAAASAAAINHIVDQHIDSIMSRTRSRPLPRGNLTQAAAIRFALALCLLSMGILVLFVNMLTAALTLISLVGYGFIYSMYLKRATPQNIVIGGAAGAAPPVLGWTAVTNQLDPVALLLFLIIFAWTPPHFWALAIYRKNDYAKADIPMLPVTWGGVHAPAYPAVHGGVIHCHAVALCDVHEWGHVLMRGSGSGWGIPLLRHTHAARPQRQLGAGHLQLLDHLSDGTVRVPAGGSLHAGADVTIVLSFLRRHQRGFHPVHGVVFQLPDALRGHSKSIRQHLQRGLIFA